uniref:Putative ribonuclease H-like domain-containing protein n=1 Tax=Tanacetum cinerariifolium TaxID=118510 RepID=A0A6L2NHD8_TANCI|nr:putative ribonuclease H-like domain-containing protein [Tanacetum cinerariifolium]
MSYFRKRYVCLENTFISPLGFLGVSKETLGLKNRSIVWVLQVVQDYALWDVIENGNSFKPVAQITTNNAGTSTTHILGPVTTEEKAQKKNNVKVRSMLLMALSNDHLMTFNQYKNAKSLFAAIETRFVGNEATKKTQKTLLKKMYENFSATSTESLDSVFNRLRKIVSQLVVLGEFILQEYLNLKFLRSFHSEWNTHVVVWRNKSDLDTMSIDDLYINFKIVKQKVKGTTSSNSRSQNMDFLSSPSTNSTNEVHIACEVSTTGTQPRSQITDNSKKGLGYESYHVVPPPPTGLFSPPKLDLSNSGLEEFKQSEFESYGPKSYEKESKNASKDILNELKESLYALLVKDRVSENKDFLVESPIVVEKKTHVPTIAKVEVVRPKQQEKPVRKPVKLRAVNTVRPNSAVVNVVRVNKVNAVKASACWVWRPTKPNGESIKLKRHNYIDSHPQHVQEDQGYVDSRCSRHITGNMSYLSNYKEFDGGYVTFGEGAKGGRIIGKGTLKTGKLDFEDVYFVKELKFNLFSVSQMCDKKNSVLFTNTGCFVLSPDFKLTGESRVSLKVPRRNNMYNNKALVVKSHNKTLYELFRGRTPALSFMRPFECHVTILNTLDHLEKFDGKSDDDIFVGYSLNSKAFRVYNFKTRKVEENLYIRFLEDKPSTTSNGPEWLFDIDMLTKSMNYVPVIAGTNSNDFVGTEEILGAGFEDPDHPDKVYKVVKALYGLHQVLRAYGYEKTLVKDVDGNDVDVHLYRSMIGSLMYLTASRLDIIYLKGYPKLGLWYPKDSPFELVAYTDSDYAGASLDRKSTTGGYQFLGSRLISWQCKKQTMVATSTTETKYVAAASCCRQVKQSSMVGFDEMIQ